MLLLESDWDVKLSCLLPLNLIKFAELSILLLLISWIRLSVSSYINILVYFNGLIKFNDKSYEFIEFDKSEITVVVDGLILNPGVFNTFTDIVPEFGVSLIILSIPLKS